MTAAADLAGKVAARQGRVILTPHHGEMSKLAGISADEVENNPKVVAADVARTFNAVVALKGKRTIVMTPGGDCVRFEGGNNGLATSGSGDVLAGLVAVENVVEEEAPHHGGDHPVDLAPRPVDQDPAQASYL